MIELLLAASLQLPPLALPPVSPTREPILPRAASTTLSFDCVGRSYSVTYGHTPGRVLFFGPVKAGADSGDLTVIAGGAREGFKAWIAEFDYIDKIVPQCIGDEGGFFVRAMRRDRPKYYHITLAPQVSIRPD